MKSDPFFCVLNSPEIARFIGSAGRSASYVGPGIQMEPARALADLASRLGPEMITVCLDFNERVMRMGYGSLEAVTVLRDAGIEVRSAPGIRTAFVVADRAGYMFTPTPLYLEAEPDQCPSPNAMRLSTEQVIEALARVSPLERALAQALAETDEERARIAAIPTAVSGQEARGTADAFSPAPVVLDPKPVDDAAVSKVQERFNEAPPAKFDVVRQVRVYEAYFQYAELKLRGAAIQRHKVSIPKSVQRLGGSRELEERLKTTYDLIDRNSGISSRNLDQELKEIRDTFAPSLGGDRGRIVLKSKKPLLEQKLAELRKKLIEHKDRVKLDLQRHVDASVMEVVDYYTPMVMQSPPNDLLAICKGDSPTFEEAVDWLAREILKEFPGVEGLVSDMELEDRYKDITYETLKNPEFLEQVRKLFPHVNWAGVCEEYKAAGEVR
jgi:hypothetical protein